MAMHNPPHPGELISSVYLEPNDIRGRELATTLGVATSTLSRVLKGSRGSLTGRNPTIDSPFHHLPSVTGSSKA
jgi:plasmid maintenance system antidote protein VapI